jgi:hypothetical protein
MSADIVSHVHQFSIRSKTGKEYCQECLAVKPCSDCGNEEGHGHKWNCSTWEILEREAV